MVHAMECAVCGMSGGTNLQHCAECEVNLCCACDSVVTTICTPSLLLFPAREDGHLVALTTAMLHMRAGSRFLSIRTSFQGFSRNTSVAKSA